jgi:hypothetical protein
MIDPNFLVFAFVGILVFACGFIVGACWGLSLRKA